jgi:hypothetical protein
LRVPNIPSGAELTAILAVVCFSAGLNVYATVGMLGILSCAGLLALPEPLHAIGSWYVIAACAFLFLLEFIGDKIPAFDLVWNAAHTFVRIPVAAFLAYAATSHLPPAEQFVATVAGALLALAAHGGKTAARAAVTASPEPFSNAALSLSEDALVVFLMWLLTKHPYAAAGIALGCAAFIVVMIRWVFRAMRGLFMGAEKTIAGDSNARLARKG